MTVDEGAVSVVVEVNKAGVERSVIVVGDIDNGSVGFGNLVDGSVTVDGCTVTNSDKGVNVVDDNVTVVEGTNTVVIGSVTMIVGTVTVVDGSVTVVVGTCTEVSEVDKGSVEDIIFTDGTVNNSVGGDKVVVGNVTVVGGTVTVVDGTVIGVDGTVTVVVGSVTMIVGTFPVVVGSITVVSGTVTVVGDIVKGSFEDIIAVVGTVNNSVEGDNVVDCSVTKVG